MVFVPRLLSRRNRKKKEGNKKSRSRSKSPKNRRVTGNYRIKNRIKRGDGGGEEKAKEKDEEYEKWIIYSLAKCKYCAMAMDLLKKNRKDVKSVDFYKLDDKMQDKIESIIKDSDPEFKMTFPRIFCIKGKDKKFIGGYSNLSKIMS